MPVLWAADLPDAITSHVMHGRRGDVRLLALDRRLLRRRRSDSVAFQNQVAGSMPVELIASRASRRPLLAEERTADGPDLFKVVGNGEVITLADAQRALHVPRAGALTNSRETISAYFKRLDSDRSGALDRQELVKLITYYRDHQNDDPYDIPRLPATWA